MAPPVLWPVFSSPSWGPEQNGRTTELWLHEGCGQCLYLSRAQGTAICSHAPSRPQVLRAVGRAARCACAKPRAGSLLGPRPDICVVGRVSAGETLTECGGAPGKCPENLSNSSALSSAVRVPRRRHWAIVDREPRRHCAGKGTALPISRMCRRFLSPVATEAHCLKAALLILRCPLCVFCGGRHISLHF